MDQRSESCKDPPPTVILPSNVFCKAHLENTAHFIRVQSVVGLHPCDLVILYLFPCFKISSAKGMKQINVRFVFQIPLLISNATHSLKLEIDALEEKLQVAQTKLTEKSEKREKNWQSLTNQVAELELQLKEEQSTHHSITEEIRQEIQKKSYELDRMTQEQAQLIQNLNQVQEEVRIQ